MHHKWDGITPRSKSCWVGGYLHTRSRVSSSLPGMLCHWAKNIGTWPRQDDTSSWHLGLASVRGSRAGLGWCACCRCWCICRCCSLATPLGVAGRSLSSCASGTALPSLVVTRSRNVEVIWWVSTSLCHLVSLLLTPFALRAWKIRHWGGRGAGKEGRFARRKDSSENKKKKGATRFFEKNRTETWKRVERKEHAPGRKERERTDDAHNRRGGRWVGVHGVGCCSYCLHFPLFLEVFSLPWSLTCLYVIFIVAFSKWRQSWSPTHQKIWPLCVPRQEMTIAGSPDFVFIYCDF